MILLGKFNNCFLVTNSKSHHHLYSIKHLNDLAGDRLTSKGNGWSPLRAYRASLEGGVASGETTVDGEAEKELRGLFNYVNIRKIKKWLLL